MAASPADQTWRVQAVRHPNTAQIGEMREVREEHLLLDDITAGEAGEADDACDNRRRIAADSAAVVGLKKN